MADATSVQSSFAGGEISKLAQGRYHDPKYRSWMATCLNNIPIESEACVRRPGTGFAGTTRGGVAGRNIKFDFKADSPYQMEFTDGHLRFRSGLAPVTTNDSVAVSSITTADPAVAVLAAAVDWSTGDQAFFSDLGTSCPLLHNRVFTLTKTNTTHFSLTDAVTGDTIDGAALGALGADAMLNRVLDITTPYSAGAWGALRSVQTEITSFLLHGQVAPYQVIVTAEPLAPNYATFELQRSVFLDGPYLDPIPSSIINPSALTGIVTLTLALPDYDATKAYKIGDFVVDSSVGYRSLTDANVGNTPASSASDWEAVGLGAPVNDGAGFVASDTGRLVRLLSEPDIWDVATTYGDGDVVSYNPSGEPGQTLYWESLVGSNTGNVPGADITHWQLLPQGGADSPALWTWGRITGLSATGLISQTLAGSVNIGTMTGNGGVNAAFDGTASKTAAGSAELNASFTNVDGYVGKDYSGASSQTISQAIVYPSSDRGFAYQTISFGGTAPIACTLNLRAKASAPASASDGTLLGTSGAIPGDTVAPVTITSNDAATAWDYVWIEIVTGAGGSITETFGLISQVYFYSASATPGTAVSLEILGPALLYSAPITTWRLGVYSDTTGWPTCGTYSDGRLWLSGAVANRVDACVANGISGVGNSQPVGKVNFAPTDQYGNVLASSAINYTFNAPDSNPIFWMIPDLQGIYAGTKAGEWLIIAPTAGGISPLNISARRVTHIGCANIEPKRTEHTIVFVQKFGRKIMEAFADVFSGKFSAPNLTKDAKHLTVGNIQEIAYQQELAPIIWGRVDGRLIGCTYKRDALTTSQPPAMVGFHRHTLGSGRSVESLSVGPSVGGNVDALTIVTNDSDTGVRHVEVMTDILDEGTEQKDAAYLDDAVTPTATVEDMSLGAYGGLTLYGLWHLNGKSVMAWLGGLDCGDYTVADGQITVLYGDGVNAGTANGLFTAEFVAAFDGDMPMRVGFDYNSDGQVVRANTPAESGARNGPAFGKLRRSHYLIAQMEGAQGVSFGTLFDDMKPALFQQDNGTAYLMNEQFTGIFRDQFPDSYSMDSMPCWRVSRGYICNMAAIGWAMQTTDN